MHLFLYYDEKGKIVRQYAPIIAQREKTPIRRPNGLASIAAIREQKKGSQPATPNACRLRASTLES